ncbi:FAD-dependent oxidoreductase [Geoglobus acetivorans]|uniref:FAD-binding oxidoreductase n=1 Tax=Geoglobus acetivorans TaxID=565033 RepID=A0ABZ3H3A9_GEOAI|nr:FAD-binding oxidoreductase [Geoglobus acetivorans]
MRVAIIGAGVMGLSTAYYLAKLGAEVTVFEQKYLLYGASGRNSGGITPMIDKKELIPFALKSLELYDKLPAEVDFNFLFRKDGYVKVAASDSDAEKLKRDVRVQNELGVKSRIIEPSEVKELVPDLNTDSIVLASYCSESGVIFPWPVVWGLAKGCRENGVEIKDQTAVDEIVVEGGVKGVRAGGEFYKADIVVNAAGAWSNKVSEKAGVKLENKILKEEICVTESIKPYLDPYLYDITYGVYLSQSARGEIVGGITGREVEEISTDSTLEFAARYAKRATQLIPKLKGLAMLRQWAGVYDEGKDGLPVVGFTEVDGFVQANGLGKHTGMIVAPALGRELAKLIVKGDNPNLKEFSPRRF